MILYVYDRNFNIVGVIDAYESLIWTNRYYIEGDFELYVPANQKNLEILQKDNYVVRETKPDNAMIIEKIIIETNLETGNYLIVKGRCLKSLLSRRIIWSQTTISGRAEVGIRKLVEQNAINPTDTARKIPGLILGQLNGFTETINNQYTGDELEFAISNICKTVGYGFDVKFDVQNKQFEFEVYKGTDRSFNQTANPYVLFSDDYENLISSEYVTDQSDLKNVAKVGGEGEGLQRRFVTCGSVSGLDRREMFVDARDISSNDGAISQTEYNAALTERGNEKLAAYKVTEAFSGDVDTIHTYVLERDFFLGDIVEVKNEYGIQAAPRIIEIIENSDENGTRTIPTFSDF